ncbi:FHA domain-containing protein [Usitatibacter palustris]|uniref:FHA domain-containing protein n=1 Tax=Usitatibacter palustris TaxID=2732487 RepID=A0A6M4H5V8_9PROT|nr:FHA domain-containing protein [Usitatibacter palustris]QJR15031.1 hypothetical protein DSM104440_01847 [Usitatibacter palustris]
MSSRLVLSFSGKILGEFALSKPVTVLGRNPDSDIVVEHAAVSSRHALFRQVDRTIYIEDLASTNGTVVNGITVATQVLHHLDLIEIGQHKLHFFDDALLTGKVSDLEDTVHTDFERTMLVRDVPAAPVTARSDPELSKTVYMPRPTLLAPGTGAAPDTRYALKGLGGKQAGQVIELTRANTMIGAAGADAAVVIRRAGSLYLARLSGRNPTRLNRAELGPGTHEIRAGDRIDVGDSSFEVISLDASPVTPGENFTTVIHGAKEDNP